jgi:type IV pilus assembly protein PilF
MNSKHGWPLLTVFWLLGACVSAGSPEGNSPEEAAQANLNLGAAYLRQGRADLALDKLQRAISQNPRSVEAHSTLAFAYDQLGDVENAEEHYRRATQLAPDNPAVANGYAVFLCRRNRWPEAEPHFRRAASNPRYGTPAAALTNAGVCARAADATVAAEEYFRAALAADSGYADALYQMMDMSYQSADYMQARAFMQRYRAAAPVTPALLWTCVRIEHALGNTAEARECARQLRTDFPESAEVAQLTQLERNAGQ